MIVLGGSSHYNYQIITFEERAGGSFYDSKARVWFAILLNNCRMMLPVKEEDAEFRTVIKSALKIQIKQ